MDSYTFGLRAHRAMTRDTLQGAAAAYGDINYPCTVGTFELREILTKGGWSQTLLGDIQIAKADLPDGAQFHTDEKITVTTNAQTVRNCVIYNIYDLGFSWSLTLQDLSERA